MGETTMQKDRDEQQPDRDSDGLAASPVPGLPVRPDLLGISLMPTPLSRGPLAAVYRGWDRVHHCDVIVKTQRATGDWVAADRFRREAAVMARLRHPNIVALYRFQDGDPSALVMEYVPGRTLAALVAEEGPLAPMRAAGIIQGIAAALDCLHIEDVVHRDVKPSNILIPPHGAVRLTDFGVAHVDQNAPLTVMGDLLGTIEYISPEQIHGSTVPDARSDVYSLAAVAYFALSGTPPFPAADNSTQAQLSVMHRQVFEAPPPLRSHRQDLSPEVEAAILRGLAKSPDARPASAGQFAAGLRSAVEAGTGAPEERAAAVASRRTGTLVGAAAGATLLALGGIAVWKMEGPASPSGAPAQSSAKVSTPPHSVSTPPHSVSTPPHSSERPAAVAAVPAAPRRVPSAKPPPVRVAVAASLQERRSGKTIGEKTPGEKAPVTGRPRFRRHPEIVAGVAGPANRPPPAPKAMPSPKPLPPVRMAARPSAASGQAWLSVYARQDLTVPGHPAQERNIPANAVVVDGRPVSSLAAGGWAALPAGRHFVSYVPAAGSGFSPNPGLWVTLTPGAHVTRRVLLPVAPRADALLAAAPARSAPATAAASPPAVSPPAVGWYTLSGWAASAAPEGGKPALVRAPAQWVKVDGRPMPALVEGGWAELPAGKHTVTFQPALGLGVGPKTWDIDLAPSGHLQQQIPLPPAAPAAIGWYTVSGWIARDPAAPKPALVRVSAQWVKVDGQPVLGLALGEWATLPAGKHTVTLQPTPGLGIAPKTWDIDLAPQAHLDQKIPLPVAGGPQ
jgi:serine/threonine protein kinase